MTDNTPTTEHKVTIDDLIDGWACEHMRADDRLEDVRDAAKKALAAHDRKIAAEAWDEGLRAGESFERVRWQWSAGEITRAVNGLTERPERPDNPYSADRIEQGGDDV